MANELWVFAYGSLLFRPGFNHVGRQRAYVEGWVRRFWQGSTDHRGTPGAPGRVVTLVPASDGSTWGAAYCVSESEAPAVVEQLDRRESGGYVRLWLEIRLDDGPAVRGLTYRAVESNVNYLGPAPLVDMVQQIRAAVGPSGPNSEYVIELARSLSGLAIHDDHVHALAAMLTAGREGDQPLGAPRRWATSRPSRE